MQLKYKHIVLKNFFKTVENYLKKPILYILNHIKLKEKNFTANFLYEGCLEIKLPITSFWKVFHRDRNIINKNS